jgi:Xaa-Pro aminopeptidase
LLNQRFPAILGKSKISIKKAVLQPSKPAEKITMTEFSQKQTRIKQLLERHKLDGLLLQRASSFAWATCGAAAYVNAASSFGEAALLITNQHRHLITSSIEAPRLELEEKLKYQGWEFNITPWHQKENIAARLTKGLKIGSDSPFPGAVDLSAEIARLRANLTQEEGVRFRVLGRLCAEAMDTAIRATQPRETEHQIAARLDFESRSRGIMPIVNLIATDERIFAYRHPLPTFKELDRYAMLVLCGRRWGLVCSITRLIHFGALPDELRRKADAVAQVDATFIAATRPGNNLRQIFQRGVNAYAACGFADEWMLHHQGGPAGYEPREYIATPTATDQVVFGQVYAWNPSITGTKSEDSIQVGEQENEVVTAIPGWPLMEVEIDGKTYHRPTILEI